MLKKISEEFNLKNLGDYHVLHVQSDTLLLANVLKPLEASVLKYVNLILLLFFSAPGLAW